MDLFWINRNVPGAQEHQVNAESYVVDKDYIHFLDDQDRYVLSIRQENAHLIERS